eukprot:m.12141 g.12141  ORF g.12141 m.12141 type:complete len:491 (+) comp5959_c0_seq2:135-1607(+)
MAEPQATEQPAAEQATQPSEPHAHEAPDDSEDVFHPPNGAPDASSKGTMRTQRSQSEEEAENAVSFYLSALAKNTRPSADFESDLDLESPPSQSPKPAAATGLTSMFQKVLSPFQRTPPKPAASSVPASHLILEARPPTLPAKSAEEERKHKAQYAAIMESARRRQERDEAKKVQQESMRRKKEHSILQAQSQWTDVIIPEWRTRRATRKVLEMAWAGIPPRVRGRVWALAIGNELNITAELFEIYQARARVFLAQGNAGSSAGLEASAQLISLDISRTFPKLCMFQNDGPYFTPLQGLLGAYVFFRPDIGYVQGMSFVAGMLLLNMEPCEAFIAFANLFNRPLLRAFGRLSLPEMNAYYAVFEEFLLARLPRLHAHMATAGVRHDVHLTDWFFTGFSRALPLDLACRVWDVYFLEGDALLIRTALGIVSYFRDELLKMDFDTMMMFLKNLPETMQEERLIKCIAEIHITTREFDDALTRALAAPAGPAL